MFTGLVETIGRVSKILVQPPGIRLTVEAEFPNPDIQIGDSIAIDGCCLTVVQISADNQQLDFEAGEETLTRTNLGRLAVGASVNLERSLAAGSRMGGHFVTGHIDGLGKILDRRDDPPWAHFRFRLPCELASQVVSKGSVAVDGISLTVVDVDEDSFTVALIPHTLEATTLGSKQAGDQVHLETDVLAKYVQRSLAMNVETTSEP